MSTIRLSVSLIMALACFSTAGFGRAEISPSDATPAECKGSPQETSAKKCEALPPSTAVDAIRKFGGSIGTYTDPDDEKQYCNKSVTFTNSNLADENLLELKDALKTINPKKLDLNFTKVKGVDLWQNLNLGSELVDLDFSHTPTDGFGLQDLAGYQKLKYLRLNFDRLNLDKVSKFLCNASAVDHAPRIHLYLSGVTSKPTGPPSSSTAAVVPDQKIGALAEQTGGFTEPV